MTTPVDDFGMLWMVATPKATGAYQLLEIDARQGGGISTQRIRLPIGVNTIIVSWTGASALSLQLRNPQNTIYHVVIIPASAGRASRFVTVEAPIRAAGYDLTLSATSVDADDIAKAVAGVKIIPSNL
ncbi:hypothetical protein [Corynebacterium glutamicum]|uniref:hypothetical protein n=1 Tax=Corynebacterium glutamicum TaxID=1718 RepID=UPI00146813C8|nr:hypothetical protein [Corynebacterium glutamicum]GFK19264.1 hypothetical protein KbCgl_18360 [Corynebacterium glutamicum]